MRAANVPDNALNFRKMLIAIFDRLEVFMFLALSWQKLRQENVTSVSESYNVWSKKN